MNCRFYFGWRFYNQKLEVELKILVNRSLSNKYASFWITFSATWKGDSLVIGALKIMWQRSSNAGTVQVYTHGLRCFRCQLIIFSESYNNTTYSML